MGLPVIECIGEAEKMCAELNRQQIVDGVMTNDGDALIYGAQTIYKGQYTGKKQEHLAHKYELTQIKSQLGISQRDLVAFALLSGSDYCNGVRTVGPKKFETLMRELKSNHVEDALDRLKMWNSNSEMNDLDEKQTLWTNMSKGKHCTSCHHEGSKQQHSKQGCCLCQLSVSCREKSTEPSAGHPPCTCQFHELEGKIKPYEMELKVRKLALEDDQYFPHQAVIDEFLERTPFVDKDVDVRMHVPNFFRVCEILQEKLAYSYDKTMSYFIPVIIRLTLHGLLPDFKSKPLSIIKACQQRFQHCYKVRWQSSELDIPNTESYYDITVPADLFASKYPDMVKKFHSESYRRAPHLDKNKRCRAEEDAKQLKITSVFKKVKRDTSSGSKK